MANLCHNINMLIIIMMLAHMNCLFLVREIHAAEKTELMPKPYFLMVYSSYENQVDKLDIQQIKVLNESPYHGIAVRLISEFDDKPFNFEKIRKSAEFVKKNTNKELWPWVFLNRIIGNDEIFNVKEVIKDKRYFRKIKGMDLYDETGALSDFYEIWRSSLKLAKQLSSPGVVFDMEAYNNFETYKTEALARKHKRSKEDIRRQLKIIGENISIIADEEYPEAAIWFLFTHLGDPPPAWYPRDERYMSVCYIAEGMMDEAEKRNLPMKFVSGGMIGLGYCHESLDALNAKIEERNTNFKSELQRHSRLSLGGTIAMWNDKRAKTNWMSEGLCEKSSINTAEDFVPLLYSISKNYNYIWVYATKVAGYDAFSRVTTESYNRALRKVIDEFERQ